MDKYLSYAGNQLAAAGFAILDARTAARLRSDLWLDVLDATADASERTRARLRGLAGIRRFEVTLDEGRVVEVLAWSPDRLAERLAWVLGRAPARIVEVTPPAVPVFSARPPAVPTPAQGGDQHPEVVTAEPGRTCGSCANFSSGQTCRVPRISGVARPLAREPRVCRGYEPVFGAHDRRGARVLWPELFSEASVPPASDAAEVEALEDKHGTLAPTARE
jgi:hypothetical protein